MGERAPRASSIVDGSCRLPSSESVADSVAPSGCSLALVAARVPLAVSGEDAQSGNRLATIPAVPAGVGTVDPSPGAACERWAAMSDGQIHSRNESRVQPPREAQ